MFSDKENEHVGFDSKWKVTKVSTAGTSQTTEYSMKDIHTSTAETKEIEIQTDEPEVDKAADVDMDKLAAWLKKIYPSVKRELDEANNSKAFKNYQPIKKERENFAELLQTVQVYAEGDGKNKLILPISTLTWNSSGRTLAVASKQVHKSWCYHAGFISLFTFDKNDKLPEAPSKKLNVTSCITVLKFHPVLPNILAGGAFTGDIYIWNLQTEIDGSLICKINGHLEGLTQVSWINDIDTAKSIILATSSLDGFLNLWSFNANTNTLLIKQKYNVKAPVVQRVKRQAETPPEILDKVLRGIICFDFSPYVADMFVVGIEGGHVVQCSMLGTSPLKGTSKEAPISDPVYKYYQPHEGELTSLAFSPNRKEMFMTTGSEGEIHVYVLNQDEPAQVIFLEKPLHSISWVAFEEKLLFGCGVQGVPEVFNLLSGRPMDQVVKEKVEPSVLTHLDISRKRPTTVAIGSNRGVIQLWNVPWYAFSSTIG